MPLNPIKLKLYPILNLTIGKYFSQNWNLFAPNPVGQNYSLLIQPRTSNDSTVADNVWYDVSQPFWDSFHRNRFSAYDRLARSQTNTLKDILSGSPGLLPANLV